MSVKGGLINAISISTGRSLSQKQEGPQCTLSSSTPILELVVVVDDDSILALSIRLGWNNHLQQSATNPRVDLDSWSPVNLPGWKHHRNRTAPSR
jgi:hypothetical protein